MATKKKASKKKVTKKVEEVKKVKVDPLVVPRNSSIPEKVATS